LVADTGFPAQDAKSDFSRARRQGVMARLANRLRREPGDVNLILPFEEVIEALGNRGERTLGVQTIPLDSIVGSVDRTREFDRSFHPTSQRVRDRWERIALAQRKGESMPPIQVYRIGDLHFVKDGHHRVSVARAQGRQEIDAQVTEVRTAVEPGALGLSDLPLKSHQRVFFERVPLPPEARGRIQLSDPWDFGKLAEAVEAWGFRTIQARSELLGRDEVAELWFREDYEPIVAALSEAGMLGEEETETEAYLRIVGERYLLIRSHQWDESVLERLKRR
jgi:hypothetical protein